MSEWDQPETNNLKFLVILENTGVVKFSQFKVVLKITFENAIQALMRICQSSKRV